ncbi:MAG TPA: winged helix-turn-helix domain-containing protein [Pyrinomonadaceae bacterium]|nr:winged helix-turn-helix domain-containing protein [Pyrinomonadaceae bacterium]
MTSNCNNLRYFEGFRLDAERKVLWHEDEPVNLALKEIELLCLLTETVGEVVTKDEILARIWTDSFVDESNLSRYVYRLRKMFEDLGHPGGLIQTVPRRGYRFTGTVRRPAGDELVFQRHSVTETVIEEIDRSAEPNVETPRPARSSVLKMRWPAVIGVGLLVILTAGAFMFLRSTERNAGTPIRSIAVLPVKSFAPDGGDSDLGLRITDALITTLGGLKEISVRPTDAVAGFTKNDLGAFEIGEKLGVDAVVDGRIQREGDRVRVTFQLLRVTDRSQIWSEQFDGRVDQILRLQDSISSRILNSVNQLGGRELTSTTSPTHNPEAYEAFLLGRSLSARSDPKELEKAISYFQKAVDLDPGFAAGFAEKADAEVRLHNAGFTGSDETIIRARSDIGSALALNPEQAEAFIARGYLRMMVDWDWNGAESDYTKAIAIAPNLHLARMRYGLLLTDLRRFVEAEAQFESALMLNPVSPGTRTSYGIAFFCQKDFVRAEEQFRKALEIDPDWVHAHWYLSRCLWMQGKKRESLAFIVSALKLQKQDELVSEVESIAAAGTEESVLKHLIRVWKSDAEVQALPIATRSVAVGDHETALSSLEFAHRKKHPWIAMVAALPDFEPLREQPRFLAILRKLNLP